MAFDHPANSNGAALPSVRYSRQMLFAGIGEAGQKKLGDSRVTLIGCGALGCVLADTLVRAGVGFIRIVDRDFIELNNLQRQFLYGERDIADGLPKAEAAARRLREVNSTVTLEALVADANYTNIERLAEGADLLLDGTDNFETRYLINDVAVKHSIPWIYGACVGSTGLCMAIIPKESPCLRCVFDEPPPREISPTCDTAGVLGPVVSIVAGFQAAEALKILTGQMQAVSRRLLSLDIWADQISRLNVQNARNDRHCPCCKELCFDYLSGRLAGTTTVLCGRQAVQINQPTGRQVVFASIAAKLAEVASEPPTFNRFMLRTTIDDYQITVFADGRAIIKGTDRPDVARGLYAKYIGA